MATVSKIEKEQGSALFRISNCTTPSQTVQQVVRMFYCFSFLTGQILWLGEGGNMIQEFANPERNARFCNLSRSCTYSSEIRHSIVRYRNFRPAIREKKPIHTIVYLWLSQKGSSKLILHFPMKTDLSAAAASETRGSVRNIRIAGAIHASTSGIDL